jgi:hypothetical protein
MCRRYLSSVIAGLDPIHPLRDMHLAKSMDPRVKPAGDIGECGTEHQYDPHAL